MSSKYSYVLTEKANQDLDEILSYITNALCNKKAASDFLDKTLEAIEQIRAFPESGSLVNNPYLGNVNVRKVPVGNYLIFYQPTIATRKIIVLRVIYGRRDLNAMMRELDISKNYKGSENF